jgi:hypothetical protein
MCRSLIFEFVFQARMKACLSQKPSAPIPAEQYIQPGPINPTIDNLPQQYYYQPTVPYPNYYPQTQFINRNVR